MFKKIVDTLKIVQALYGPKIWTSPDVAMYINEYMEQHPGKKLTRRLAHKLQWEFYCLKRSGKK